MCMLTKFLRCLSIQLCYFGNNNKKKLSPDMNIGYIFLFAFFVTCITLAKEMPIKGSTFIVEADASHNEAEKDKSDDVKYVSVLGRTKSSRMLTLSTTLSYDDFWFYTTRRPPLSYKDFPGRPGVATWREISPGRSSEEKRKSRTMSTPTTAGVSSSPQSISSMYHYAHIIWVLFLSFCVCCTWSN